MEIETRAVAYCFEDSSLIPFYRRRLPEQRDYLFSLSDLVGVILRSPTQTRSERLATFVNLLPENLKSEAAILLTTIEEFRHARVLNEEDWDFLFSEALENPKIKSIRQAVEIYLGSDLKNDEPGRVSLALEQIAEQPDFTLPFETHFVPAFFPSPLFLECATQFSKAGLGKLWLPDEIAPLSGATLADAFEASRRIAVYLRRLRGQSSMVLFDGNAAARTILRLALRAEKLSLTDGIAEMRSDLTARESAYRNLRANARIPLPERLKLSRELLHLDAEVTIAEIETWQEEKNIPPAEIVNPPEVSAEVEIVPFHVGPWGQTTTAGFWSGELGNVRGGLFSNDERERLVAKGYPIASVSRQLTIFRSQFLSLKGGRTRLYATANQSHLFSFTKTLTHRPKANPPGPKPLEPAFTVPERSLSATQLEAYAACPAKYFYGQILRLRPHPEMHESDSALIFGQAAHSALENFFKAGRVPVEVSVLQDLFEAALIPSKKQLDRVPTLRTTLRRRFRDLVKKVEGCEAALLDLIGPTIPQDLELPFEFPIEGVLIRGKIDRVDRTPDGKILVLDYKTGTVSFTPEQVRRGENFQALFYLWALMKRTGDQNLIGILFYDLKKGEVRRGLLIDEMVSPAKKKLVTRGHVLNQTAFAALLEDAQQTLSGFLSRLKAGDFTATPSAETCRYCEFAAFCREAHGRA